MSSASSSSSTPTTEFFPSIPRIEYEPEAPKEKHLCFRYYNPSEVVLGRSMSDWLRFAVCYWHTFRWLGNDPFGTFTLKREWDDGTQSLENAKKRIHVAFEFFHKLQIKHWTFHDRDIAPEGSDLKETEKNLDAVVDEALKLQTKYGIKALWGTANLFSNPRYMSGAATNPDFHVFAYAAAQVKKAMDVTAKLGGENYVFWGGREGFSSLLNTNVRAELDHYASFLRMAAQYKRKMGYTFQLLIEPKAREPTAHQYDYDAQTVIGFLKYYGLENDYKLNIEPNHSQLAGHVPDHDLHIASKYGFLGSVDANIGGENIGWDEDRFLMDIRTATTIMLTVIEQGGLGAGGLNFDAKVRRESHEVEDMFLAHIGSMDCFARALRIAAKIHQDGVLKSKVDQRYASWSGSALAKSVEEGKATLDELHAFVESNGEPQRKSGRQELFEIILNQYIH